jgi:hypothetical protein
MGCAVSSPCSFSAPSTYFFTASTNGCNVRLDPPPNRHASSGRLPRLRARRFPIAGIAADNRHTWRPAHAPAARVQPGHDRSAGSAPAPARSASNPRSSASAALCGTGPERIPASPTRPRRGGAACFRSPGTLGARVLGCCEFIAVPFLLHLLLHAGVPLDPLQLTSEYRHLRPVVFLLVVFARRCVALESM